MRELVAHASFRRNLKRVQKRGLERTLLDAVIDDLRHGRPLAPARRDHPLRGNWQGWRDCHIGPDWLLI